MSIKDKPVVATHLKKRNIRKSAVARPGKKIIKSKTTPFKRLERFVSKQRSSQNNANRMERYANKPNFVIKKTPAQKEAEKVYIVVRVGGSYGANPALNKALRFLRLTKKNQAVIVKATPTMDKVLAKAQQYITWGTPDLHIVQDLLQKRGYARAQATTIGAESTSTTAVVPLSDNKFIEEQLGKYGIVCIEDIVHELITAGPNFGVVSRWLAPFELQSPKGGLRMLVGNGKQPKQTEAEKKLDKFYEKDTHNGYHTAESIKALVSRMI